MKSLPSSQPLLGEIPPELVAGILGRSYDVTPCAWLPFRSVFSSCPSLLLSLRLVLSFSLFLFLVFLMFRSVAPESLLLLFSVFFSFTALFFISCYAHSLPPLFPAHLCFFLFSVTFPFCFLPSSSRLLSVFSLFFHVLSSSVLPVFFLPLLSLTLPPLRSASLSPFIAKTACVFYNKDVRNIIAVVTVDK